METIIYIKGQVKPTVNLINESNLDRFGYHCDVMFNNDDEKSIYDKMFVRTRKGDYTHRIKDGGIDFTFRVFLRLPEFKERRGLKCFKNMQTYTVEEALDISNKLAKKTGYKKY